MSVNTVVAECHPFIQNVLDCGSSSADGTNETKTRTHSLATVCLSVLPPSGSSCTPAEESPKKVQNVLVEKMMSSYDNVVANEWVVIQ